MANVFLSPSRPALPLSTEPQLRAAAEANLLVENHFLELKREIPTGRSANQELARDLASLAVDGGTLIVGIAEVDGVIALAPQPLSGLAERVEQIAGMIPDPPIVVTTQAIESEKGAGQGYLLVQVPPSPLAPHMVADKYLGRGDKTKRYLTDPEVLLLHSSRRATLQEADTLIERELARDPVPTEIRRQAHLFLLAQPLAARPEMLLGVTHGRGWQARVFELRSAGDAGLREACKVMNRGGFSPSLDHASDQHRRPGGVALSSYSLGPGRVLNTADSDPESVVDFEVHEDGGIRIFMGRLSDELTSYGVKRSEREPQVLFEAGSVAYVHALFGIVLAAAEMGDYYGNWFLAVAGTGLRGTYSYAATETPFGGRNAPYSEDEYRRATVASYVQLKDRPGSVANGLVGALLRAFGTWETFAPALTDEDLGG